MIFNACVGEEEPMNQDSTYKLMGIGVQANATLGIA
jgi:hypothetical protein